MLNRSFAMAIAMALLASLAFSAPGKAGTYITTVTAVNASGKAADDFEANFSGAAGTISNITVKFSSGVSTTTQVTNGGNATEIDFSTPLGTSGVIVYQFETTTANISLAHADWTFKSGPPIKADSSVSIITAAVPEPASMALLGVGMAGLFSALRLFRRRAIV